jgi:hypothetical protein
MSSPEFQPVLRDGSSGRPVRPVGVIVAAIVLGLLGCMGLFASFSILAAALFVHSAQTAQYPPGMVGVQIAMGFVTLLVSAFCVLVVIGLFQMKSWARIGILILGGFITVVYGLAGIGFIAFGLSSLVNTPNPGAPNVTPAVMRAAFLGMGVMFFLLALVGVWWLVYFNLRRIRELFATGALVAAPESAESFAGAAVAPPARQRSVTEILLICLAVVYMLGALNGPILVAFHWPLFFFGVVLRGTAGAVCALLMSALSLAVGIGLLRRAKPAWFGAIALQVVGVLSGLLLFVPSVRATMVAYQQEIQQRIFSWMPASQLGNPYVQTPGIFLFSAVFGLVLALAILWFLLRARPLFEK